VYSDPLALDRAGTAPLSTDKDDSWIASASGFVGGGGDVGTGAGTQTHTWDLTDGHNGLVSGGNFIQSEAETEVWSWHQGTSIRRSRSGG